MERNRRRFVPGTDSLEGRQLLASFNSFGVPASLTQNNVQPPSVIARTFKIERLPRFFLSVNRDRYLPGDAVAALQQDLRDLQGRIGSPSDDSKQFLQEKLRGVLSGASLSTADIAGLNQATGAILRTAGAPEPLVDRFVADLTALAQVDTKSPQPSILAANDYSIVIQTALAVGKPLRTPPAPRLVGTDDSPPVGDNVTTVAQPHLVGRYDSGATVVIVDQAGHILGSATAGANNRYSVQFAQPLAPGTYVVGVQASFGTIPSAVSPMIALKVVPRPATPAGPRG